MTDVFEKIADWADERNLISGASQQAQMMKLMEEVGELSNAIIRDKEAEAVDAIGDIVVVLTIIARQRGFHIVDAVQSAYNQIKDRKGIMVDGVFVKNEEILGGALR